MSDKILLSISILVSNRIDTIEKTLSSLKPLLDAIPSELVIVDTVGEEKTDGSLYVAQKYTDKIVHFDWINDFAAARNAGLKKCTGEWFMFMDDDEWFDDISEMTEFFRSGEYKNYNSATYLIHDHLDFSGAYNTAVMKRMVARTEEMEFVGKVHEMLNLMTFPVKHLDCYINHYGYAFKTLEDKKKHFERNMAILRPEFEKDPWNMHNRMQFIQEHLSFPEHVDYVRSLCIETFEKGNEVVFTPNGQWIVWQYIKNAGPNNHEETLSRCAYAKEKLQLTALTRLIVDTYEMTAAYKTRDFDRVIKCGYDLMGQHQYVLNNEKEVTLQACTSEIEFAKVSEIADKLAMMEYCLRKAGNLDKADKISDYRDKILRSSKELSDMCEFLCEQPEERYDIIFRYVDEALKKYKNRENTSLYQWLYVKKIAAFETAKYDYTKALNFVTELKSKQSLNETVINAISYEMTRLSIINEDYNEAYKSGKEYFDTYNVLVHNQELKQAQMVKEISKYTNEFVHEEMIKNMAYVAVRVGKFDEAWTYLSMIFWEMKEFEDDFLLSLAFELSEYYENNYVLLRIIKAAVANPTLKGYLGLLMQNPVVKQRINYTLEQARKQ